jgi:hypothetical protein
MGMGQREAEVGKLGRWEAESSKERFNAEYAERKVHRVWGIVLK